MMLGESSQVGQGCQGFQPAESCPLWPATGEAHTRAAKAGQVCYYICFGSKDPTKETRDPLRGEGGGWQIPPPPPTVQPFSSFSVTSPHCYLARDMSPEITFGEEILAEKFKARALGLC